MDRTELQLIPKADLHVHLEGTVSNHTLRLLADRNGISLESPVAFPGGIAIPPPPGIRQGNVALNNFSDFIGLYVKIADCIRTREDIQLVGKQYALQAREENIIHSELYFSASTFRLLGRDMDQLFLGLRDVEELAKKDYGLTFSWILDIVRNASKTGEEVIELAEQARELGATVKAIGLAGDELAQGATPFRGAFKRARSLGFKILAHAGETAGPESIREVLQVAQPERIGHGISVLRDSALVREIISRKIPVEVCPWSNISLKITNPSEHPLRAMIDAGIIVVLGADDPGIFEKTLTDNFVFAANAGVTSDQLQLLAKQSLDYRL